MSLEFIGRPHDFDFLVGRWTIANRRLKQRHAGGDDWDEFPGTSQAWSHLDGLLSVDENDFAARGFTGATIRTLNLATQRWSIYWVNNRTGHLQPPVIGGWSGDRGEFIGIDDDEGRPVLVRFVWKRLGADHAHWEQAFSLDGLEWETNWMMDLRRA